jgi:hypothetical protein
MDIQQVSEATMKSWQAEIEASRAQYADWRAYVKKVKDDYYEVHKACPSCGNTSTSQTYVGGSIPVVGHEYVHTDPNRATCNCGWQGMVEDLVPEKTE